MTSDSAEICLERCWAAAGWARRRLRAKRKGSGRVIEGRRAGSGSLTQEGSASVRAGKR